MKAGEVFTLLAVRYSDKPDEFKLSIGHQQLPFPDRPMSIYNMPEIQAYMSLTMAEIRRFAEESQ